MSLLTICTDALNEVGLTEVPTFIIGNNNATARLVLSFARREGKILAKRRRWTNLQYTHEFTTVDGVDKYDVPADFDYLIPQTEWNRTNYWRQRGPATPQTWERLVSGIVVLAQRNWFRINQGKWQIYPAGTSTPLTLAYQYMSKYWVDTDADGLGDAADWQGDADTALVDEELITMGVIWRIKNRFGEAYEEDFNRYERQTRLAEARDGGQQLLNMLVPNVVGPDVVNVPDGNWNV